MVVDAKLLENLPLMIAVMTILSDLGNYIPVIELKLLKVGQKSNCNLIDIQVECEEQEMTVGNLKEYLNRFDDNAEIFYFDSEAGEDVPLSISWLTIEDAFEDEEIKTESEEAE